MRLRLALALAFAATLAAAPAWAAGGGEEPAKAEGSERKLTASPSWVSVDPIGVAIVRSSAIKGMFLVEFGLDIPDEDVRARAVATLPRLRDVWVRAMSDFAATRVRVARQADLDALTTRLQGATDRALGATGARVLLLQAVVRER